jgi:hypothetical protein
LQVVGGKSRATGEERGNEQGGEQSFHEHEMDFDFCQRVSRLWPAVKPIVAGSEPSIYYSRHLTRPRSRAVWP